MKTPNPPRNSSLVPGVPGSTRFRSGLDPHGRNFGGRSGYTVISLLLCLAPLLARGGSPTTVMSTADHGSGSLRDVVAHAANNAVITFNASAYGTIVLTTGPIEITVNLTIQGPGAKIVAVDGNAAANDPTSSRVFHVNPGLTSVSISGLTIQNGLATGIPATGGGILNEGGLSLSSCVLSNNTALGTSFNCVPGPCTGGSAFGGGICNSGQLAVTACTVAWNTAQGGQGTTGGAGFGGGVFNAEGGAFAFTNSTISANNALGAVPWNGGIGGPIAGAGICDAAVSGSSILVNCTVTHNLGTFGDFSWGVIYGYGPGNYSGGGLSIANANVALINTLLDLNAVTWNVALNPPGLFTPDFYSDLSGAISSLGHNLFGYNDSFFFSTTATWSPAPTDKTGVTWASAAVSFPADNGGPTPTEAIARASAARDAGDNVVLGSPYNLSTDQRGYPRASIAQVDIGAYEYYDLPPFNTNLLRARCLQFICTFWQNILAPGPDPPPDLTVLLTNAVNSNLVTMIDSTTALGYPETLTISNLFVGAPLGSANTLLMTNSGLSQPLLVLGNLNVLSGGSLYATNSALAVGPTVAVTNNAFNGSSVVFDGPATFTQSTISLSNAFSAAVGNSGPGTLSLTNSTLQAYNLLIGAGSNGVANLINSTSIISHALLVSTAVGQTGQVTINGGQLIVTNASISNDFALVLDRGAATMTISNATVQCGDAIIGNLGPGTVNLRSGTLSFDHAFLGMSSNFTGQGGSGTLNVLGGQVTIPGLHAGVQGTGTVTVANGTLSNNIVVLAEQPGSYGSVWIQGGTHKIGSSMTVASGSNSMGLVTMTGGTLNLSNATLALGAAGNGQLLASNSPSITAREFNIGSTNPGSVGSASLLGGTCHILDALTVSGNSSLWLSNSTLQVDRASFGDSVVDGVINISGSGTVVDGHLPLFRVGRDANGVINMSGGSATIGDMNLGNSTGRTGTLNLQGGSFTISDSLTLGASAASTGVVAIAGGTFNSSPPLVVGGAGYGSITNSGGLMQLSTVMLGNAGGSRGSITVSGGTTLASQLLQVGNNVGAQPGLLRITAGLVAITNASHNAVLLVANGTVDISGGTLIVDTIIATNPLSRITRRPGATVTYKQLIMDPNLDLDGDGVSNGAELLAGTDPFNPASLRFIPGRFGVVNMIPTASSAEVDHNTEPSLGVGSGASFGKFVAHTFVNSFVNPTFTSSGDFYTWAMGHNNADGDATLDWSPGGTAYLTTLGWDLSPIQVLSSVDPGGAGFSVLGAAGATWTGQLDQPWIKAASVNGVDHIYVGYNDLWAVGRQTAKVRFSVDSGTTWQTTTIEKDNPGLPGQDSPAIRLAISGDGSHVYALFQRWNQWTDTELVDVIGDVVLVRDDNAGMNNFGALPSSTFPNNNTTGHGTIVANDVVLAFSGVKPPFSGTSLGKQRLAAGCDVAVHPNDPKKVYVAYTTVALDQYMELFTAAQIRIMSSSDGGNTFGFERAIASASLPSLAVAADGTVGLLYAEFRGKNLEVHYLKAYGGDFENYDDRILARFPNGNPSNPSLVYIGDYFQLKAVGNNFYGIFSASGEPDPDHFPSEVYYQRYVKVGTDLRSNFKLDAVGTLATSGGSFVQNSIDPFFFFDIAPWWWHSPSLSLFGAADNRAGDPFSGSNHLVWPIVPTNNPPIQLQTSTSLAPNASWTTVTNFIQTNGLNEAAVSTTGPARFYRLVQNAAGGQFELTAAASANGSVIPLGVLSRSGFSSQTFTATPGNNYSVASWYVDGAIAATNVSSFTISNITADHTVLATFAAPADLAVTIFGAGAGVENPPIVTNGVIYQIRVANVGLGTVTGVTMTNILPPGVSFVSATNTQGVVSHSGSLVTASLGTLSAGAAATIWITAIPAATGSITDVVTVACSQFEPNLTNNTATDIQTVVSPVTITGQPQSQSVTNGGTATFSVVASGDPSVPLRYRWIFNSTNLVAGATNATLTLIGVTPASAGSYLVNVYQFYGPEEEVDEDSQSATLTVP